MSIGTRIMEIRKKNNLSQEAFGETLGMSRQAISKWEMDASIPEAKNLILMSQIYHVSVGYILGIEKSEEDISESVHLLEQVKLTADDHISYHGNTEHLKQVEQIVAQYLDALSLESKKSRRKNAWLRIVCWCISTVGILGLLYVGMTLYDLINDQVKTANIAQYVQVGEDWGNLVYEKGVLQCEDYLFYMSTDSCLTGFMGKTPIVEAELVYYVNEKKYQSYDLAIENVNGSAQSEFKFDLEIPLQEKDVIVEVVRYMDEKGRHAHIICNDYTVYDGRLVKGGLTNGGSFIE